MNKSELIDAAAQSSGLSKNDLSKALDSILDSISGAVRSGERVSLSGFGTFERRERAARTGRNPQTGEQLQVAASKAPAFKPAKAFKDAVNG
jgi:DNA-binding protein HU-beta